MNDIISMNYMNGDREPKRKFVQEFLDGAPFSPSPATL